MEISSWFTMNEQNCIIFNWNVRGLNGKARRKMVRDLVQENRCAVVCLQETKMDIIDEHVVRETLGAQFARNYTYLPAQETRGEILLAAHEDFYTMSQASCGANTVTANLEATTAQVDWWIIGVYGPQDDGPKLEFLN